jgi:hypothetical protein
LVSKNGLESELPSRTEWYIRIGTRNCREPEKIRDIGQNKPNVARRSILTGDRPVPQCIC